VPFLVLVVVVRRRPALEYIRQKRGGCPQGNDNAQPVEPPSDNRSSTEEAPEEEDDRYFDERHGSGPELLDDPGPLDDSLVSIWSRTMLLRGDAHS